MVTMRRSKMIKLMLAKSSPTERLFLSLHSTSMILDNQEIECVQRLICGSIELRSKQLLIQSRRRFDLNRRWLSRYCLRESHLLSVWVFISLYLLFVYLADWMISAKSNATRRSWLCLPGFYVLRIVSLQFVSMTYLRFKWAFSLILRGFFIVQTRNSQALVNSLWFIVLIVPIVVPIVPVVPVVLVVPVVSSFLVPRPLFLCTICPSHSPSTAQGNLADV